MLPVRLLPMFQFIPPRHHRSPRRQGPRHVRRLQLQGILGGIGEV